MHAGYAFAVAIHQALLVIADIGGYTRFMREHTFALAHAQDTVSRLIEAVIDASRPLRLAKLEGDAAFLYAPLPAGADASHREVLLTSTIPSIYRAFHTRRTEIASIGMCNCAACVNVVNLRLKFVAHAGQVAEQKVKRYSELAGMDVILVHRMLKNEVPLDEYVLMTEAIAPGLPESLRGRAQDVTHDFEGIGPTATRFLDVKELVPLLPDPPPPGYLLRMWRKICQELRSLPYSLGPKKACENFHNVEVEEAPVPLLPPGAAT